MSPLVVLTFVLLAQGPAPSPPDRPAAAPAPAEIAAALESALADAIVRAEPSVVAIHRRKGPNPEETRAVRGRHRPAPTGERDDFISFDYGSGVVIGDHGEILTAFHVVRGADRLVVHAVGGQSFDAEVIAADPRSDMAVIVPVEDKEAGKPRLKPIAIGDSTRLRKGSFLLALGNHFNAAREDGRPSASWGILSNVARRLDFENEPLGSSTQPMTLQNHPTLLQLDAKLNLGMSGGAVVDLKGELVGLTTTAASPSGFDAQAGYAIPMDRIGRRIVETLRQGKEVEYGLLGVTPSPPRSNRVGEVRRNSPAGRGALQLGDEIIAVDSTPVTDFDSLILAVGVYAPGDSVKLKIRRSDAVIERTLVLAKYPVQGEVIATNRPAPWRGLRVDYASTMRNTFFGPADLDATAGGVVVADVEEGSPAASAGLKKGVVILRVGERPIQSPRAFAEAVNDRDGPVVLDTDMGVLTVGTADSSRPKSPDSAPPDR